MITTSPARPIRLDIPVLPLPEELEARLIVWPNAEAPGGVVEAIRQAQEAGLGSDSRAVNDFVVTLRTGLAGESRSVVVSHQNPDQVVEGVSLLGTLLGDVTFTASAALGGPSSVVPTGGIDRYEQSLHTDSTPWSVPNRWSVLGLLHADPALEEATTGILPWSMLDQAWTEGRRTWAALQEDRFAWREQYAGLEPLSAPICGEVPRWFRPALAGLIDDPARRIASCHAVDEALRRCSSWYETVVAPGRILLFDNHGALHRGPAVREPSLRTLLRLKADGIPER